MEGRKHNLRWSRRDPVVRVSAFRILFRASAFYNSNTTCSDNIRAMSKGSQNLKMYQLQILKTSANLLSSVWKHLDACGYQDFNEDYCKWNLF